MQYDIKQMEQNEKWHNANRTRFKFENNGNATERKYDQMKIQHIAITTKCKYDIM